MTTRPTWEVIDVGLLATQLQADLDAAIEAGLEP